jgi:hypothetical protein
MTDTETEVAPLETAENEESNIVSLADIMEASGVDDTLIDSKSTEEVEEEQEEVVEEEEGAEYSEPEPEPEPEAKTEDSDGVKKRIGKLIEAKNQAEAEKQLLEEEMKSLKKQPQKGLDQFEGVETFEDLKQRENDAEHLRDWLLENPNGGEYIDESGSEHDVDSDQARKLMAQTDKDLRKNIPAVGQKIQLRQQNHEIALKTFDWLKDDGSPEKVEMNKIISMNPDIANYVKKDPYGMITLGYAVEGFKAIRAKTSATKKTSVAPKIPSAPSRANPSVVKGKSSTKKKLYDQAQSGDLDSASSYIESLL